MKAFFKFLGLALILAITVGITYILTPRPYQVHWHANFLVLLDGEPADFSSDFFMEEVSRCNITEGVEPEDRIHLHGNMGDLVHVHMAASTWGDLFSNLRWNFGSGYIVDNAGDMYRAENGKNVYYFINGERINNPHNIIVGSEDRLLVYYGTGTAEEVASLYANTVAATAHEYNQKADPSSCSTNTYGFLSPIIEPIHEWIEHNRE